MYQHGKCHDIFPVAVFLSQELTVLGLVSLALFILDSMAGNSISPEIRHDIHVVHITLFIIAVTYAGMAALRHVDNRWVVSGSFLRSLWCPRLCGVARGVFPPHFHSLVCH